MKQDQSNRRIKQWRQRWFTLQDSNLIYYKEMKKDVLGRDCPPDGVIPIQSAVSISPDVSAGENRFGVFKIVTTERTYFLQVCPNDTPGTVHEALSTKH